MPSGHVAFACVAAGTVFALVRSRALRAGAVLYVALVVAVIVATANHFWLDAAGGAAAALVGLADRQSSYGVHPTRACGP